MFFPVAFCGNNCVHNPWIVSSSRTKVGGKRNRILTLEGERAERAVKDMMKMKTKEKKKEEVKEKKKM